MLTPAWKDRSPVIINEFSEVIEKVNRDEQEIPWAKIHCARDAAEYREYSRSSQHSSRSETYGDQQGSAYNGYFECTCYHPLFLFNQHGDLERATLRLGNHNSAKFWRRVLLPVIERYRERDISKYFRGDAAPKAAALPLAPADRSLRSTGGSRDSTERSGTSPDRPGDSTDRLENFPDRSGNSRDHPGTPTGGSARPTHDAWRRGCVPPESVTR